MTVLVYISNEQFSCVISGFQMVNARVKVAKYGTCMYNIDEDTRAGTMTRRPSRPYEILITKERAAGPSHEMNTCSNVLQDVCCVER